MEQISASQAVDLIGKYGYDRCSHLVDGQDFNDKAKKKKPVFLETEQIGKSTEERIGKPGRKFTAFPIALTARFKRSYASTFGDTSVGPQDR